MNEAQQEMHAHHVSMASCKAILSVREHMQIHNIDEKPEAFLTCVMMKTLREMMGMMPPEMRDDMMEKFVAFTKDTT